MSASVRENGTHTWVVGDGSMWMFHQVGSKSSAGHVQIRWFGRRLAHSVFARIRHKGQRSRSSFVSLRRSLFRRRSARTKDSRHHPSRGVNGSQPVAAGHQQFGRLRCRSHGGIRAQNRPRRSHTRAGSKKLESSSQGPGRELILHGDEKTRHQAAWGLGGRSNADATVDPAPVCCDEHGPLSARRHLNSRVVHARYGLRGSAGLRSQQPRTALPVPSPFRKLVGG